MRCVYDTALAFTLRWEGGYVNHPNDPGGATMRGVTQAVYDRYRRRAGKSRRWVKRITDAELAEIYRRDYWDRARCDSMPDLIAICHFDWAVNTGVGRAIEHLQQTVGTPADGIWGPNSRAALERKVALHGEATVARMYMDRREEYYLRLARSSRFRVFLDGWLNRLNALRELIRREAVVV